MQVLIHYHGVDNSPWLEQFLTRKSEKLERYLSPSSQVHLYLKHEGPFVQTTIEIQNTHRNHAFSCEGETIYESFSQAIEKAVRSLGEEKRKIKDKINSRFFSLKKGFAL